MEQLNYSSQPQMPAEIERFKNELMELLNSQDESTNNVFDTNLINKIRGLLTVIQENYQVKHWLVNFIAPGSNYILKTFTKLVRTTYILEIKQQIKFFEYLPLMAELSTLAAQKITGLIQEKQLYKKSIPPRVYRLKTHLHGDVQFWNSEIYTRIGTDNNLLDSSYDSVENIFNGFGKELDTKTLDDYLYESAAINRLILLTLLHLNRNLPGFINSYVNDLHAEFNGRGTLDLKSKPAFVTKEQVLHVEELFKPIFKYIKLNLDGIYYYLKSQELESTEEKNTQMLGSLLYDSESISKLLVYYYVVEDSYYSNPSINQDAFTTILSVNYAVLLGLNYLSFKSRLKSNKVVNSLVYKMCSLLTANFKMELDKLSLANTKGAQMDNRRVLMLKNQVIQLTKIPEWAKEYFDPEFFALIMYYKKQIDGLGVPTNVNKKKTKRR